MNFVQFTKLLEQMPTETKQLTCYQGVILVIYQYSSNRKVAGSNQVFARHTSQNASELSHTRSTWVCYHFLTQLEEFVFTQLSAEKKGDFQQHKTANCKIDTHKSFKSGMWKMLWEQCGNFETPENYSSVSQPVSYNPKLSCRTVVMVMMMMMMMMLCSSVMRRSTQSLFSGAC